MRLYLTAKGRYVGTQDDAKRDGKGWSLAEVPTDKAGLIDYLNDQLPAPPEFAEVDDPAPPPPPTPSHDVIAAKVSAFKTDEIVEFILDIASVSQVERIFACIGTRFAELVKGNRA